MEPRIRPGASDKQDSIRHALRELAGGQPGGAPPSGTEYRVLTESADGMHTVVGIAPWPSSEDERAEIRSAVRTLLDLADIESGPARSVVVRTPDSSRVVDCVVEGL